MTSTDWNLILEAAARFGAEGGRAAGSWAVDGNTSTETLAHILRLAADGESLTEGMSAPLSGEWAGGLTEEDVFDASGWEPGPGSYDDDMAAEILDAFESAYWQAAEDEILRAARAMMPAPDGEPNDDRAARRGAR